MTRHLAPARWLALAAILHASGAAHAQDGGTSSEAPEELAQPAALDRVGITTAAVAKGANVDFRRAEKLGLELNLEWAFLDHTSMFHPAAIRALMRAGGDDVEAFLGDLARKTTAEQRAALWARMEGETETLLIEHDPEKVADGVEEIKAWITTLDCSASAKNTASKFPELTSRRENWERAWDEICAATKEAAAANARGDDIELLFPRTSRRQEHHERP